MQQKWLQLGQSGGRCLWLGCIKQNLICRFFVTWFNGQHLQMGFFASGRDCELNKDSVNVTFGYQLFTFSFSIMSTV